MNASIILAIILGIITIVALGALLVRARTQTPSDYYDVCLVAFVVLVSLAAA